MGLTETLGECCDSLWKARKSKGAQTFLKGFSILSGCFLLVAGVVAAVWCILHFFHLDFSYLVCSLYTIFFGLLVLVIEVKDKTRVFAAAFDWIDFYLKFLTFQRGKGMFYACVGLLVFFIGPSGENNDGSHWGVNNVAALLLATIGFLHTFKVIKEAPTGGLGPGEPNPFTSEHAPQLQFVPDHHPLRMHGSAAATEWGQMTQQGTYDMSQ